jgi:type II secretory pathway pseudopilin PulG
MATPTAKYIQDMQALMSGGIGPLSTGEKISALGQVLQAAGSRGATDPAAVIQNVRQQQMQKLNAQYQIAQMQQARTQAEQQAQLKAEYIAQLKQTNPQLARAIQLMSADDFAKLVIEQNKAKDPTRLAFDALGRPRDPYTGVVISPAARLQNLPTVASDEQFNALPSGAKFVDPDGNIRRKP